MIDMIYALRRVEKTNPVYDEFLHRFYKIVHTYNTAIAQRLARIKKEEEPAATPEGEGA
jgi:hypothetical protein